MHNFYLDPFKADTFPGRNASIARDSRIQAAETTNTHVAEVCPICRSFFSGAYYRVAGQMTCAICAIQARARRRKPVLATIVRGLRLSSGAALVGLALSFLKSQNPFDCAIGLCILLMVLRIS